MTFLYYFLFIITSFILPNGHDILNLAFKYFPQIVMRIPRNFDLEELTQYNREFDIIDDYLEDKLVTKTVYFKSNLPSYKNGT